MICGAGSGMTLGFDLEDYLLSSSGEEPYI